ncbi:MAG: tetratricopeptide repeat protein, partial [Victivallaceae bacterium]|nr:tetratricopeptide repeat protein [Victivallaceae bacterium]
MMMRKKNIAEIVSRIVALSLIFLTGLTAWSGDNVWTLSRQGNAAMKLKEYKRAASLFERIIREYPESRKADEARFCLAACSYSQKKFPEAVEKYRDILKKYPDDDQITPMVLFGSGICFRELKKPEKAGEMFERILRQYPLSDFAVYSRLLSVSAVGPEKHFQAAGAAYLAYLMSKLENAPGTVTRGLLKNAAEKFAAAAGANRCAARLYAGDCLRAGSDYREAVGAYRDAAQNAESATLWIQSRFFEGFSEALCDNYDTAEKIFREITAKYPGNKECAAGYFGLGYVNRKIADNENGEGPYIARITAKYRVAAGFFEKVVKEFPESVWRFQAEKNLKNIT